MTPPDTIKALRDALSDHKIIELAIASGIPENVLRQGMPYGYRDQVIAMVRALTADASDQAQDAGPWRYDTNLDTHQFACRYFLESDDSTHDVRLYINGDFANGAQREQYGRALADTLNAARPAPVAATPALDDSDAFGGPVVLWLDTCVKSDIASVSQAGRTLLDYWQGASTDVEKMLETNQLDELGQEVARLQKALCFWLPSITDREDEVAERILQDAFLLCGIDGNIPDDFKSAQELGWVTLAAAPAAPIAEVTKYKLSETERAALEEADKTGALFAEMDGGAIMFINRGEQPGDFDFPTCPTCHGSGHVDDTRPAADHAKPEPVEHAPKFNEAEFDAMVERGTKAWSGVPDGWLEEQRGNGQPEPVKATPEKSAEISNDPSFVEHAELAEGAVIDSTEVFKTATDSFNRGWNAGYQAGQQAGAVDGEDHADHT